MHGRNRQQVTKRTIKGSELTITLEPGDQPVTVYIRKTKRHGNRISVESRGAKANVVAGITSNK